jgi:AcrR family transcriptional regulator
MEPRKSPVQARSAASVQAILKATLQVLVKVGKERLTTTLVAARAGVSVGTLYQYFPNKSALLRSALQCHMDEVTLALQTVCHERAGASLQQMAEALVTAFLEAKTKDIKASAALYAVSSDIDGAKIVRAMSQKANRAIVDLLASSKDELKTDPHLAASMLQAIMAGASRQLLESPSPEAGYPTLRNEVVFLACAYLRACSERSTHSGLARTASRR